MTVWAWIAGLIAGAVGQFIDTVAGMGFGAFSGSILLVGGLSPVVVVATVNMAKVGSGLASGLSHWRFGNVRWPWVLPLALPAMAGAVVAALLLAALPREIARLLLPLVLLAMGVLILRRFLFARTLLPSVAGGSQEQTWIGHNSLRLHIWRTPSQGVKLGAIGVAGGALNGISGAFGPFTTSAVLLSFPAQPRYIVGTVNFVEFFVAAAVSITLLVQLGWAGLQWQVLAALITGSLVTAPLGAYLSRHIPARALGIVVAVTLIGVNVWSLLKVVA
ncbi:MAG: sulfite exporter TauE/SafE family protein [Chloroflexi bacterium]|nr:sulfite exporter TauE/SafE family protein [Chloroflexota bacterium]